MEYLDPDTFSSPPHKAIVEGLARAVGSGRIHPASARLQNMDDPTDHAEIVNTRLATRIRRKMRHQTRKLLLGQPEHIANRRAPTVWEGES